MTSFPPPSCLPSFHILTSESCIRHSSHVIKHRDHSVQNATVSLKCSYVVCNNMIKPIFPNHNVLETLDGIYECVEEYAFIFLCVV